MNKQKIGITAGVLLLLVVGTIWAMRSRADARMQKVRELAKETFANGWPRDPEKMDQFRSAMDQLSPDQRRQFHEEGQRERERREDQELAKFFSLPPAQRNEYLDKRLREEERRHKEMESRFAQRGQMPNRPGPGANAGGPPSGRRSFSSDEKMQRRNRRLDNRTPEQRAQRAEYRAALDKRRKELGLPQPQRRPRFHA